MNLKNRNILLWPMAIVTLLLSNSISANYNLSEEPISLKVGVQPNLFLTFDDSGSMTRMYVPDGFSGYRHYKRFKSSTFNAMYYNPAVNYEIPRNKNGVPYVTSFTSAELTGYNSSGYNVNLSNNYMPGYSYSTLSSTTSFWNSSTWWFAKHSSADVMAINGTADISKKGKAYYYNFDTSNTGCDGTVTDDDCYDLVIVGTNEEQNFANWFSFYRNRTLAAQSAAMLAFRTLSSDVRVGWHALNKCVNFNASCNDQLNHVYDNRIAVFSGTHRDDFFDWLENVPASGGTPLRNAFVKVGELLSTTDIYNPYAKEPGHTLAPEYACRATYHVAMTDGIWNGSVTSVGNVDGSNQTLPDNSSYTTSQPYAEIYKDAYSNTLSDFAFKYWKTDARTNINNDLSPFILVPNTNSVTEYWDPKNDPATWQHMVNFTVGFGLGTSLTDPKYGDNTFDAVNGDYGLLLNGTKNWPKAEYNSTNNPYDLWHAAINSRGEFFSADNPNDLVDAFDTILQRIAARQGSLAAPAANAFTLNRLDGIYSAYYDSSNWTGTIAKTNTTVVGGNINLGTQAWDAQAVLDARTSSRNIMFNTGAVTSNGATILKPFSWSELQADTVKLALLNINPDTKVIDGKAQLRMEYLQGDRSQENNLTGFRERAHLLGDMIHSSPIFVGTPVLNELDKLEGGNHYRSFKTTWANRDKDALIYTGSNDGMLHAFRADNGEEQFAFIPSALFPKLNTLTDPKYIHSYFVDGRMTSTDVYIDHNRNGSKEWRTVLVGTLRGGAQGLYAMDVTDPANIELLWEIDDTLDRDLGYLYGKPQIARLHNGDWAVIIGNGINNTIADTQVSTTGNAVVYAIDLATGALVEKFDTGKGSLTGQPNGILTPTLVDLDGDLKTDYMYSGDLHGNVWRFDLTVATDFVSSTVESGTLLYSAKDYKGDFQPITAKVSVTPHKDNIGLIVMFGTGKYFEGTDASLDKINVQSLYGVLDPVDHSGKFVSQYSNGTNLGTVSRSDLQEQTFEKVRINAVLNVGVASIKELSDHQFCWIGGTCLNTHILATPSGHSPRDRYGWYIDFIDDRVIACTIDNPDLTDNCKIGTSTGTASGEILVSDFAIRKQVLFFQSKIPNEDPCQIGSDHWLYAIDSLTGTRTTKDVFDINGDNKIDHDDRAATLPEVVSGVKITGTEGSEDGPTLVGDHVIINTSGGGGPKTIKFDYDRGYHGRQSWIQLR